MLSQVVNVKKTDNYRHILNLNNPNAVITKVLVNDLPVKLLPWAPYEVDVTDFIKDGTNKISVKLYPGNRNLLGPHHNVGGELYSVGPSSFSDKPGWADGDAKDIWTDNFCFVEFGLK